MTWAILASGQSLTKEDVAYVKAAKEDGRLKGVGAVSNVALDMAPWADFIVSHDSAWWRANPKAKDLNMKKYCRMHVAGTEQYIPFITQACNSGLMAMDFAYRKRGAERLLILGFDMHGTHYFGKHPDTLKHTDDKKFKMHLRQFDTWNGCPVINCTPGSALTKFPFMQLREAL